ncbi:NifU family protein [Psychroserpens sp.]|jgi:Fe-S cluster biogenesis protein NfuA|uniref:NifU family protein n=1 Tax=Psychroserpens sp. TaxID=2020870 RepID=UPI0039E290BF
MNTHAISIKETTNPSIIKFETNQFITQHDSFEFNNIDEASSSPLAQQLFYLPFVKKVYISSNFIAIEKFNIVEWKDVQNEVADQIGSFLNSGDLIVKVSEEKKKTPVTVYAESTPNPSVLKFVANKKLVTTTHEFTSIDDTKYAPMAAELFHFPFVKSIFIDENFISITKFDVAEWSEITIELREFIRNYVEDGKTIIAPNAPETKSKQDDQLDSEYESRDDISKEIINILEEYVKPAVASDGGNIEFQSYDPVEKKVKVLLQGACSGCPSSTFTLKSGIENMLKEMMKGKVEIVEAING